MNITIRKVPGHGNVRKIEKAILFDNKKTIVKFC